ncbi:hypothetical protein K2173_013905 [Erythroxylum novogranatense]|uniref:PHD-type domain-containing protein n=1 Tax=Erythroxylum novogranatense TaxID=1862640 RepID=A0AAV8SD77_9ROSI|nr:hypothetical protein K2173_013905 [Erythroxylum novogranatense]
MAKGADAKDMSAAKVRPGLKREFEFAFRYHSEIYGLGRTRSGRVPTGASLPPRKVSAGNSKGKKRFKSSEKSDVVTGEKLTDLEVVREEEAKSDVVELGIGDEEAKIGLIESVTIERSCDVESLDVKDNVVNSKCIEASNKKGVEPISGLDESGECEHGTSGSVPVFIDLDDSNSEPGKATADGVSEAKIVDECEEGTSGLVPVSMGLDDSKSEPGKATSDGVSKTITVDEWQEGASGSPPDLANEKSARKGILPASKTHSESKEEKPFFRRFTRSALKAQEIISQNGTEESNTEPEAKGGASGSSSATAATATIATSRKTSKIGKFPTKLKDLLDSGLLEGMNVKYLRGSKVRGAGEAGLRGVINGSGILCFCHNCRGNEVVTPSVFELHAASANKRPPEYIYLDNGHTLRDVINACRDASLETLDESLDLAIGCPNLKKSNFCLNCRGVILDVNSGKSLVLCGQCINLMDSESVSAGAGDTNEGTPKPLSVPKYDSLTNNSSLRGKSHGRLTRKDLRLHKLVFEEDVLPDGTEVAYYSQGKKLLTGYKHGYGIFCYCCSCEVSPSQFEAHAGWASRRKPYLHIYTSNGVSLHELSISLSKDRKLSTNENDDLCQICQDGGNLLCCDGCPRAFHRECLSLLTIPKGKWYCRTCLNAYQKEKLVEKNANAIAAGRIAGVDPIEQISRRCIRIVKLENASGGCVLCREHDFENGFGPRTVIICDQCEKEHHVGCLKDNKIEDLKELPKGDWFCCSGCARMYSALQKLVIRGEEKLPDSCLNVIKKRVGDNATEMGDNLDVRWRFLNGRRNCSDDAKSLLSDAVAIFHERFDPIVVKRSASEGGNIDLIPSLVFGENDVKTQELGGMHCAVLLVNHVVVSAAIVRILGEELAELPLVATSSKSQGQGFFQALFSCIEKLLGFLNVKNIVLPAAEEAESIWTNKFGFSKMGQEELTEYRRDYRFTVFQGTSMLRKVVPKCRIVRRSRGG